MLKMIKLLNKKKTLSNVLHKGLKIMSTLLVLGVHIIVKIIFLIFITFILMNILNISI